MTPTAWSERLVTAVILAFALWTLCCQAVVAAGQNLYVLVAVFTAVGLLVLALTQWPRRPTAISPEPDAPPPSSTPAQPPPPPSLRNLRWSCAAAAVVGTPLLYFTGNFIALWWWIAGWLLISFIAVFFWERPTPEPKPVAERRHEVALWSMALLAIVLTLFAHRSDYDDSIYINFAVAAADQPGEPLLSKDTLHGIEGLPLSLLIYRLQSWELLIGAFSWLSGISAIKGFHFVGAALAALLLPLAYARLFRLLVPRMWPWAVAALLVVLVAAGETHRWYGNFAFVRLWQGKSILVSILLPLVAAFALEYMMRPTARRWLLLCAVQVAAVGANVTALWAAPAVALSGLVCGMQPSWRSLRHGAMGALASSYILAAGAMVKKGVSTFVVPEDAVFEFGERGDLLRNALFEVLGKGDLLLFGLIALPLAWALTPAGLGRRFATGLPLAVWVVLLNPYTAPLIFKQVTGPAYWRLFWSLPLPLLMTLVLISPLQLKGRRGVGLSLALLLTYALFVPSFSGISRENRVLFHSRPMLKVRWPMYRLAMRLNASVDPGSYVLAPDDISMWIPTLHHHVYPLKARHYLNLNRFYLGEEDFEHRGAMMRYVAGEGQEGDAELFRQGLECFPLAGVCLRDSPDAAVARTALHRAGFLMKSRKNQHEIWTRDRTFVFNDNFEQGDLSSWSEVSFEHPNEETTSPTIANSSLQGPALQEPPRAEEAPPDD